MSVETIKIKELAKGYCVGKTDLCLAIGIVHGETIERLFLGDSGNEVEACEKTYEIGSITKVFTANCYLEAFKNKGVDLQDKIFHKATILEALTHTSNVGEMPDKSDDTGGNKYSNHSVAEVIQYVQGIKVPTKKEWAYCNLGFGLAGIYLEEIYEQRYADLIECYIKKELKLEHTLIGTHRCEMTGYNHEKMPINWTWKRDDGLLAAGALQSNLEDMIQFLTLQMKDKNLAFCQSLKVETEGPFNMGLGWMLQKDSPVVFCMGLTEGFGAFIGINPLEDKGIVLLANYRGGDYGEPKSLNQIGLDYLK